MVALAFILSMSALALTFIDFLQSLIRSANPFADFDHYTILGNNPLPHQVCIYYLILGCTEVFGATILILFGEFGYLAIAAGLVSLIELVFVRANYIMGRSPNK
jgi:hypothetical protein